jgi:hypothetical protein
MSKFVVVRGELAAWALGLGEADIVSSKDDVLAADAARAPVRRKKRRLGHELYRLQSPRRIITQR